LTAGSPLRRGAVDSVPFVAGTLAWAAAVGAAAVLAGFGQVAAVALSAVAFSGTAQLAVVKILALPLISIFATSLLLSLRFVPMTLTLNHQLALPRWRRVLVSATIVDASFFLAARRRRTAAWPPTWSAPGSSSTRPGSREPCSERPWERSCRLAGRTRSRASRP
jgi:predicted branched-subunit amino acid permease